jgi:hypothetical protein
MYRHLEHLIDIYWYLHLNFLLHYFSCEILLGSTKFFQTILCLCLIFKTPFNIFLYTKQKKTPWPLVSKRTIPTERLPLVGEI